MKRALNGNDDDDIDAPHYHDLYGLPCEILVEILTHTFPDIGTTVNKTRAAFVMRLVSLTLRQIIDTHLLERVTTLDPSVLVVMDNDGLVLFKGLNNLAIGETLVTNEGLSRMTRLEHLGLTANRTINAKGIRSLVNLKSLRIGKGSRYTKGCLATLTKLETLKLRGCGGLLSDEDLQCVPHLKELSLTGNERITGSCFSTLTCLQALSLKAPYSVIDEQLASLSPTLQKLCISYGGRRLTDNSLRLMTNVVTLGLEGDVFFSDEALMTLTSLTSLNLDSNKTITGRGLSTLTSLKSLSLMRNNRIIDANLMPFAHGLQVVWLSRHSRVTWLSLCHCPCLTTVCLPYYSQLNCDQPREVLEKERGIRFFKAKRVL